MKKSLTDKFLDLIFIILLGIIFICVEFIKLLNRLRN